MLKGWEWQGSEDAALHTLGRPDIQGGISWCAHSRDCHWRRVIPMESSEGLWLLNEGLQNSTCNHWIKSFNKGFVDVTGKQCRKPCKTLISHFDFVYTWSTGGFFRHILVILICFLRSEWGNVSSLTFSGILVWSERFNVSADHNILISQIRALHSLEIFPLTEYRAWSW